MIEEIWSYSRVNSYENCPRQFQLSYIEKIKGKENGFAQFGSFIHELIEKIEGGELTHKEATDFYTSEFDKKITAVFPYLRNCNFKDKYYTDGLIYLKWYKGFPYQVEAIELPFLIDIGGHKVRGFIDMILKTKEGGIIILDHKSKGEIKPCERDSYFKQLYIYSLAVEEIYKQKPIGLALNLFRNSTLIKEAFSQEKQDEAVKWFKDTIDLIKTDKEFNRGMNPEKDFFCNNICSYGGSC